LFNSWAYTLKEEEGDKSLAFVWLLHTFFQLTKAVESRASKLRSSLFVVIIRCLTANKYGGNN